MKTLVLADHYSDDDYSPMFSSHPERSEIGGNSGIMGTSLNGSKAFANGFMHGMGNPIQVAREGSGIGLFVNYMSNTQQSDFN